MDNMNKQFTERRKYVRVFFSQKVTCDTILNLNQQDPVKLEEPLIFSTSNISVGGINMFCDKPIEEGTLLFFNIDIDSIIHQVTTKVIYCVQGTDDYFIGCEFISPETKLIEHIKRLVTRLSFDGFYNK